MVGKVAMADVVEVVVVGVFGHPAVEVRPCQDILYSPSENIVAELWTENYHSILLILNGLDSDFRQEIIVQHIRREV